ncbi:fluoride efflux transporter CrcB [Thermosynechococcaceae cyanobacterium BACA0444]|uniref:Fluoride-specific ion channel FluC n=1 Tax=Pseudocalidococcus azoricus BACA0444 TaxID=2918990 RepID=A0AAE4FPD5_9CYAN|nr:fluoride efflux transporter CrcB [Pseudocalidococcus azoricus]MDS3859284.1 fluoride efflux transporter CrcB [Pseudocalidococcus azoricus BACA0444]
MITIPDPVWVAIGAVPGALCRYYLSLWALQRWGTKFPWGTLMVNVSGAFLIGFVAMWPWASSLPPGIKLMILTGFLGAYTTFSTYALDTVNLGRNRVGQKNWLYGIGSPLAGLGAGELGVLLGQHWF